MPGTSSNEQNACLRMDDRGYGGIKVKTVLPYDRAHPQICREGEFFSGGGVKTELTSSHQGRNLKASLNKVRSFRPVSLRLFFMPARCMRAGSTCSLVGVETGHTTPARENPDAALL